MLKKGNLLLIFIIGLFLLPITVYGEEKTAYFDKLFNNDEYTINTDIEIKDYPTMSNLVDLSLGNLRSEYSNPNAFISNFNCSYDKMTCEFVVSEKITESDGRLTLNELKKYQNIKIKTNTKIDEYFSMVKDNKMVINYDEEIFETKEEKTRYIEQYVSSFTNSDATGKTYYKYYNDRIRRYTNLNEAETIYIKKVDDIVFRFEETAYSDEFKKLTTDGKVVINTNLELSDKIINEHVYDMLRGNINISKLKGNKAYVQRTKYDYDKGTWVNLETHLVEFSVKNDIDTSLFAMVKNGKIDIPTTKLEDSYDFDEYFKIILEFNNDDNEKKVEHSWQFFEKDSTVLAAFKYDKNHSVESVQYYKVGINYTGFSKEYSDAFKNEIGKKLVVYFDYKSEYYISKILGYNYKIISCSNDYSSCAIALPNHDNKTVEVHNVDIEFSKTPSKHFKEVFNIKEDGTVDILADDTKMAISNLYFTNVDKDGEVQSYSCGTRYTDKKVSCTLTIENSKKRIYEQHEILVNLVKTDKSEEYKKMVVDSKVVYPGELTNVNYVLRKSNYHKDSATSTLNGTNCSTEKGGCDVVIRNSSNNLEVHFVPVKIEKGKSPEFTELFPGDTIEIPVVFKDDTTYINDAFHTYMLNKTQKKFYLVNYKDGKALVNWDENEAHTYNIKFVEGDKEKAQEIDEIAKKVDEKNITVDLEDLDLVNLLYYGEDAYQHRENVKIKNLDNAVKDIITNKHISYSLIPSKYIGTPSEIGKSTRGTSGTAYEINWGGPMVFYYDGVAYNFTKNPVVVSYKYVLYIPGDTKNTVTDYINAAQKKIDDYLGANSGVTVSYNGPAADEGLYELDWDLTNCDKNEYSLRYKDSWYNILIIKDSSKTTKPEFVATDVINNIVIKSENASYPTDTIVSTNIMKEDTDEFKAILKLLKTNAAQVLDISLYSPSVGVIKDFSKGAVFKVTVPLTNEKLKNKKLVAYYLDDEGNVISEHPVVVENGMATFETTHFSTYVIAEKKESLLPELPNTVDAIFYFIGIAAVAILGMALSKKYLKHQN